MEHSTTCLLELVNVIYMNDQSSDVLCTALTKLLYIENINRLAMMQYHKTFDWKKKNWYDPINELVTHMLTPDKNDADQESLHNDFADVCWENVKDFYTIKNFPQKSIHQLWQIFTSLASPKAFPPMMSIKTSNWLLKRLSGGIGITTNSEKQLNMNSILRQIEDMIKLNPDHKFDNLSLQLAINDCFDWIMNKNYLKSWLYKRTLKNGKCTSLRKRWIVLNQEKISYFTDTLCMNKKNEFSFQNTTSISFNESKNSKTSYSILLSNGPHLTLELSTKKKELIEEWYDTISQVIDAKRRNQNLCDELLVS